MSGSLDNQLGKLEQTADETEQRAAAIGESSKQLERDLETQGMTDGIKMQAEALRIEQAEVEQTMEDVKKETLGVVQKAKSAVQEGQAKAANIH